MALNAASFRDPMMRDDLQAYYDKMKGDAVAGLRARPEQVGGSVKIRDADGTVREAEVIPISAEQMEKAFVSFDTWLEIQGGMFARYEERAEMPEHADAEMAYDFVYEGWQAGVDKMNAFLLGLQEVDATDAAESGVEVKRYDFTNMTRQDIKEAGMELFRAGKITLDELFKFEHPDGKLRIGADGHEVVLNPFEKLNFVDLITQAMRNMEATGEATKEKSVYPLYAGLLEKLKGLQEG